MTARGVALLLALMAAPAGIGPALAQAQPFASPFIAPAAPMVLTSTISQPSGDGSELTAMRSYLVRFEPEGGRIRVDGVLLAVTMQAPSPPPKLPETEGRSPADGVFPLWLDGQGMLVAAPGRPRPSPLATDRLTEDSAFWPRDVFRPIARSSREVRDMPLPDGTNGEITIRTETALEDGILSYFHRETTTELGGDRRRVSQRWTLVKAP